MDVYVLTHISSVWPFATLWTVVCQAPLFRGFSRQEYGSGLSYPPPGGLHSPGIKPVSLTLQADSLPLSHQRNQLSVTMPKCKHFKISLSLLKSLSCLGFHDSRLSWLFFQHLPMFYAAFSFSALASFSSLVFLTSSGKTQTSLGGHL